jgi:hypothetical protein
VVLRRAVLLALLLGSFAQAAGDCAPSPRMDLAGVQTQLNAARALWFRRGPAHYELKVETHSFFSNREVQVRVSTATTARFKELLPTGKLGAFFQPLPAVQVAGYTVPGLFTEIAGLLADGRGTGGCGEIVVFFDPADGHLLSLRYHNARQTDSGYSVQVSPISRLP